jgi:hypothetical protein
MDCLNATLVMISAAIGQIVAIDYRNDDMRKSHPCNSIGELGWLGWIGGIRSFERFDRAEPAATRTLAASDHESCSAAGPTVMNIGAAGFFAHRVKRVRIDGVLGFIEDRETISRGEVNSQPFRQPSTLWLVKMAWLDRRFIDNWEDRQRHV